MKRATVTAEKRKKTTADAIARGQETARKAEDARIAKEERQRRAEEAKAEAIIAQIPDRAERESEQGRNHAIVMSVKYEDYTRPHGATDWRVCQGDWLKGVAKLVFEFCVEANLKPTLEDWHDGVGMNSGHNIVIHW